MFQWLNYDWSLDIFSRKNKQILEEVLKALEAYNTQRGGPDKTIENSKSGPLDVKHLKELHEEFNFKMCYDELGIHITHITELELILSRTFKNLILKSLIERSADKMEFEVFDFYHQYCTLEGRQHFFKESDLCLKIDSHMVPIEFGSNKPAASVEQKLSWWCNYTNDVPFAYFCTIGPAPCSLEKIEEEYNSKVRPFKLELWVNDARSFESSLIFQFTSGDKEVPDIKLGSLKLSKAASKEFVEQLKHTWMIYEHNKVLAAKIKEDEEEIEFKQTENVVP